MAARGVGQLERCKSKGMHFSYKKSSSGDLGYSMATLAENTVLCT